MIPVTDALALALLAYPFVAFALERTDVIAAVPRPYRIGLIDRATGGKSRSESLTAGSEKNVQHPAD